MHTPINLPFIFIVGKSQLLHIYTFQRYTTEDRKCIYVMYATFAPERIQLAAMFTKTLKFC